MKKILVIAVLLAIAGGLYYFFILRPENIAIVGNDINNAKNSVVATTDAGIDSAVQSAFKGVGSIAPIYYVQNGRNYGVSSEQNICNDTTNATSLGNIIAQIQKYTNAVSCTAAIDYPSRSFTITAPSKVSVGQYFCTDQSGVVGLIPNLSSGTFIQGVKCK